MTQRNADPPFSRFILSQHSRNSGVMPFTHFEWYHCSQKPHGTLVPVVHSSSHFPHGHFFALRPSDIDAVRSRVLIYKYRRYLYTYSFRDPESPNVFFPGSPNVFFPESPNVFFFFFPRFVTVCESITCIAKSFLGIDQEFF